MSQVVQYYSWIFVVQIFGVLGLIWICYYLLWYYYLRLCWNCIFKCFHYLTDKEYTPKTVNDMKLINAGKILENNRTLAESRLPVGELPGMIITMHLVLRPPTLDNKSGNFCNLSILYNMLAIMVCRFQLLCSYLRSWSYHLIV